MIRLLAVLEELAEEWKLILLDVLLSGWADFFSHCIQRWGLQAPKE